VEDTDGGDRQMQQCRTTLRVMDDGKPVQL
jgi:hypothetical protein